MTGPGRPDPTPAGTRRRLQALMNRGWSPAALEQAAGLPAAAVSAVVAGRRGARLVDRQVAAAYDQLWNQDPPLATPRDRARAAAARTQAERREWPPPMAWDDELIDQPDASPAPGWKPRPTQLRRAADLAEDMAFVREHGGYNQATVQVVAARLGVSPAALEKASSRVRAREAEAG
jgi:hypothetical protein